jgi:hypothetical protein
MGNVTSVRNVRREPVYEMLEIPEYIKMSSVRSYYGNVKTCQHMPGTRRKRYMGQVGKGAKSQ